MVSVDAGQLERAACHRYGALRSLKERGAIRRTLAARLGAADVEICLRP